METLTVLSAGWKGRAACAAGPTAEALATANLVGGAGSPCACDWAGGIYLVAPSLGQGEAGFRRTSE